MLSRRSKARWKALVAVTLAAALAVTLVLATTGSARTTKLKLQASPSGALKFSRKKLSAKAGTVTIVMTNPKSSGLTHAIEISGHGVEKEGKKVGPGHTSTASAKLKAGTYTFYCPVDGHKAAGMKGKLVVTK